MVSRTGLKNQLVKMRVIALDCLNLFMHATKIIQAAKYMIMTVTCLIERRQNSLVYLHEIGQFTKIFHEKDSFTFSQIRHIPLRSCKTFIICTPN